MQNEVSLDNLKALLQESEGTLVKDVPIIDIKNVEVQQTEKKKKSKNVYKSNDEDIFFLQKMNDKGDESSFKIRFSIINIIKFLAKEGFRNLKLSEDTKKFIKLDGYIIFDTNTTAIRHYIKNYIESLEEWIEFNAVSNDDDGEELSTKKSYPRETILETYLKGLNVYTGTDKLDMLPFLEPIIMKDTVFSSFFFFKNGYVEVSKDKVKHYEYQELKKNIFASQILDRDFEKTDDFSFRKDPNNTNVDQLLFDFEYLQDENGQLTLPKDEKYYFIDYITKICDNNEDRILSLITCIGYLLHNFYDYKLKAIILTDSSLSKNPAGRTGKGLLISALEKIRNVARIAGKTFDLNNKHRYDKVKIDTQVTALDDIKSNFNFEMLFNDITEGITVDMKGKDSFSKQTKMIIATNKLIQGQGDSHKDRKVEFELHRFFTEKNSPLQYYKQWFFSNRDWSESHWSVFDNFMLHCIQVYFYMDCNIVEVEGINLAERRFTEYTCEDFADFSERFEIDTEYELKDLFINFKQENDDYNNERFKQNTFKKWLDMYAVYKKYGCSVRKSNGRQYITFFIAKE